MDILSDQVLPIDVVDVIAREALGSGTPGVSVAEKTRIHLIDDSQSNQDKANDILSNFGDLSVSADKTVMNEGDADPIVTCNDASISGDSEMGYAVYLDGLDYASGTTSVSSGEATLNLVSPVAGVYEIYMYRTTGNYASGSVTITVNEV